MNHQRAFTLPTCVSKKVNDGNLFFVSRVMRTQEGKDGSNGTNNCKKKGIVWKGQSRLSQQFTHKVVLDLTLRSKTQDVQNFPWTLKHKFNQ
jgi:hypothetical protein